MFDFRVIARCQLHKIRNVKVKVPTKLASAVESMMRAAYRMESRLYAEATLEDLARQLSTFHPGAGSFRERPAQMLTVSRLLAPPDTRLHAALAEPDRVHDRDLPRPLGESEVPAERPDGAAPVRREDARGQEAVPQGQRLRAPAGTGRASTLRSPKRRDRHTHRRIRLRSG